MRKMILIFVVALLAISRRSWAVDAKSASLEAARQFARETIAAMEIHEDDALGGPFIQHKVILKSTPAIDLAVLRSALQDPQLDIFSVSASAFTLGRASDKDTDVAVRTLLLEMTRAMFAQPHVQHHLLVALGARAVPELVRNLGDSMVLEILADMGVEAKAAVPSLKAILGTRNAEVAAALAAIGTEDALSAAIPVLIRVAGDPYDPWAKHAAIALGRTRKAAADPAIPVLRRLLSARDPDTRLYTAAALARLGDSVTAAHALGAIIHSKNTGDPIRALVALQRMGTLAAPARDDLIAFVQDEDQTREKRAAAALTLARIVPKDAKAIAALKTAITDPALAGLLSREVTAMIPKQ